VYSDEKLKSEIQSMFNSISSRDVLSEIRTNKSRVTCSVVGNSDLLLGSNYGSVIDSSDVVIR